MISTDKTLISTLSKGPFNIQTEVINCRISQSQKNRIQRKTSDIEPFFTMFFILFRMRYNLSNMTSRSKVSKQGFCLQWHDKQVGRNQDLLRFLLMTDFQLPGSPSMRIPCQSLFFSRKRLFERASPSKAPHSMKNPLDLSLRTSRTTLDWAVIDAWRCKLYSPLDGGGIRNLSWINFISLGSLWE